MRNQTITPDIWRTNFVRDPLRVADRRGCVVPKEEPAYLRIAADLRARILAGEFAPGDRIPTETQLMALHGVSRTVAKWAVAELKRDGLVEGRRGSGVYVREVQRLVRRSGWRDIRSQAGETTSPFARDAAAAGRTGHWDPESERTVADLDTARRLAIEPGDPVMSTRYVFYADDEPIQLAHSREPLAITAGTPVEWPEDGAAVGVVARFDTIGVRIDEVQEEISARMAYPHEIDALRLPRRGGYVLVIERTYFAESRPVETADIVLQGDRYRLQYRLPIA
jgi:DNA-binding GntR family transcriptional regulator